MNVKLQSLIGKLDDACRGALEAAAGLCLTRTNYEVDIEHLFLKLVELPDGDLGHILRHYQVDSSRLTRDLTRALDQLKTGNARTPSLSPNLPRLFQQAWLLASVDYAAPKVRAGHLACALLENDDLARLAREISKEFTLVSPESLRKDLPQIVAGSSEDKGVASAGAQSSEPGSPAAAGSKALDQYTIDLTARARNGQIDPVLGRDFEIRQMIDILTRRRQNNPILTGEAGVGKTAVVEGFARRIAEGDVPEPLQDVAVRTLDLGLLSSRRRNQRRIREPAQVRYRGS